MQLEPRQRQPVAGGRPVALHQLRQRRRRGRGIGNDYEVEAEEVVVREGCVSEVRGFKPNNQLCGL